ncbi:MAG: 1-(5-phosphoribosyl)-5-amino-4-imidazole-carboxylate carboxylase, partial [Bacteroidota bacterium]|nr:1-(5-phosphoribosyl)-5-amino-4-imidazole-carboxylate carboxylase [Bacteroidota bacterium]
MNLDLLKDLLEQVKAGEIQVDTAVEKLKDLPFKDMGFAKIDNHREIRTGYPEVIFSSGKT